MTNRTKLLRKCSGYLKKDGEIVLKVVRNKLRHFKKVGKCI